MRAIQAAETGSDGGTRARGLLVGLVVLAGTFALACVAAGCGDAPVVESGPASSVTVKSASTALQDPPDIQPALTSPTLISAAPSMKTEQTAALPGEEPAELSATSAEIHSCFASLASQLAPLPVYAPAELPPGTTLAQQSWPVLTLSEPSEYSGAALPNPRLSAGPEPSADVLVNAGEGWVIFLENFRGDLGDVSGEAVGQVGGHAATLYEVNGGSLVQWTDSGRWYGVFARGRIASSVVAIALKTRVLQP